jgi:5-methylcytosine-specific restriction endonuclease McrA
MADASVANPRLPKQRECAICKAIKPASDFYSYRYITNQGKYSIRLETRCIPCSRERRKKQYRDRDHAKQHSKNQAYRAANRDRIIANVNAYRAANRDKVLLQRILSERKRRMRGYIRNHTGVRKIIDEALELARVGDKFLDAYSGELIDRPTIDHIVPLSAGGEHVLDNLCITSFQNNRSKRSAPLLVWLAKRAKWKP